MPDRLPVDDHLAEIVSIVGRSRALVLTADPGAGKTTRVPPALVADGPVVLLQPRRIAARAVARRIAEERGWTIGDQVGWQIRFDRRFTPRTQLLVVTEGILTARLQQDPLLSGFRTVVVDEFHERSIHADLALALARQAWLAREDLRIVVMSATLDTAPVAAFLGGCPVVSIPGRPHPIEIDYRPEQAVADAAVELSERGDVLCFLPGAAEITRAVADIRRRVGDTSVLPLHGSLAADDQDAALRPSKRRRIIVATNIAETSLTVPGVTAVVDSGLHKVARYDAERGVDSLELERITADAADQRAGRAGRIAPGMVLRLWDSRDRLRPHREPEIDRVDLAAAVLDVVAWGGMPAEFEWFERPPEDRIAAAVGLLERLGAVRDGRLTMVGDEIRRLPLHPRLARLLMSAAGARSAARACALLSERHFQFAHGASCSSDLLAALDDWTNMPAHVRQVADDLERAAQRELGPAKTRPMDDVAFRRAVLNGYPDRVAQRREAGSPRVRLASGAGATLTSDSGVRDAEFLVALDVQASTRANEPDARVRLASAVDRDWLTPTRTGVEHRLDAATGRIRAFTVEYYDALVIAERPTEVDVDVAARLLAGEWLARGPSAADRQLLRRLAFAGRTVDLPATVAAAAYGARTLDEVRLSAALDAETCRALDRDAPETIVVPTGRTVRLDYDEHGGVTASVKLQELFGMAETPRVGPRREPVLLVLLAPNGRPVQRTRDLRSFWARTYPEVRKELRGRYPRHPWPEDPWSATPTARAKPRR